MTCYQPHNSILTSDVHSNRTKILLLRKSLNTRTTSSIKFRFRLQVIPALNHTTSQMLNLDAKLLLWSSNKFRCSSHFSFSNVVTTSTKSVSSARWTQSLKPAQRIAVAKMQSLCLTMPLAYSQLGSAVRKRAVDCHFNLERRSKRNTYVPSARSNQL